MKWHNNYQQSYRTHSTVVSGTSSSTFPPSIICWMLPTHRHFLFVFTWPPLFGVRRRCVSWLMYCAQACYSLNMTSLRAGPLACLSAQIRSAWSAWSACRPDLLPAVVAVLLNNKRITITCYVGRTMRLTSARAWFQSIQACWHKTVHRVRSFRFDSFGTFVRCVDAPLALIRIIIICGLYMCTVYTTLSQ